MPPKRIQISPSWVFTDDAGNRIDPHLFRLLAVIRHQHKLTEATRQIGVSYRHGWNLIRNWSTFFGSDLVKLERGRGASLTPLGEKLLWAEQRASARFNPQMENLASELNVDIQRILNHSSPLLQIHASYGYAVALLPTFDYSFQLDIQYKSPLQALQALNSGSCDMAGFPLPAQVRIERLLQDYARLLDRATHRIVHLVTRHLGLHVQPNNPKAILRIDDLARDDVRFVNRDTRSGTRAMLDQLLLNSNVQPHQVNGYQNEEFTHSAVAAYVASDMADTAFGVEPAARQFGLDFVPVTTEDYLLVCHRDSLEKTAVQQLLDFIRGDTFSNAVQQLPGYSADGCGTIKTVDEVFGAT
ncbi:MAG: helix-turn-helix transcriptional regulator [Gammaproteobacteria bacterium]|uniref:substrate-binding domain-containing protein n=1 Tax=Pseudomaricurvus alcaniphilus TaxID=1166482 RepID=UPI00140E9153|nr:substrate-binding domain-containing protein [Pseudomaricurvus alcaniphilus]MBR9913144.1 helix-turn-helix transcriptional regulator [Gammaproteobacteria bacterium]NHN37560.1 helix-turn-helix transcriptional regulator [Pseudomaricurvus alcaniphilus]